MRIIGRIYRGARHISSNFEVKSPDDLAGKPFRAVPLDLWVSMVTGFGATPTPVEVAELPTALMTGLVVGQENPLTMITSNSLYEVQSHVAMTGHMQSVLAVFINEDIWQGLSEENRTQITQVLDAKAEESLVWAQESEAELVAELTEKGMTVVTEEDGLDIDAFRERVLAQINGDFPSYQPYIETDHGDRVIRIRSASGPTDIKGNHDAQAAGNRLRAAARRTDRCALHPNHRSGGHRLGHCRRRGTDALSADLHGVCGLSFGDRQPREYCDVRTAGQPARQTSQQPTLCDRCRGAGNLRVLAFVAFQNISGNMRGATPTLKIPFWIFMGATTFGFAGACLVHMVQLRKPNSGHGSVAL
ncbi:TRAP transporter substrate-binding protein DctP [Paracoccus marcusii]|nr:TRAP transporter substrate-binding protein DctP [Paracoccus marcusii]